MSGNLTYWKGIVKWGRKLEADVKPFAALLAGDAYRPVVLFELRYGLVTGAYYTEGRIPNAVLRELHEMDRLVAKARQFHHATQYVAGRMALQCALDRVGAGPAALAPLVPSQSGAVLPPRGFVASISHKDGIAIAIAARDYGQRVGVDLESMSPSRNALADRILRPDEMRELAAMPAAAIWPEILARFCIKEAAYKAISGFVGRTEIGFKEMAVHLSTRVRMADGFREAEVNAAAQWGSALRILAAVGVFGPRLVAVSAAEPSVVAGLGQGVQ